MKMFNWIDKLLANPSKTNLLILNKVLTLGIPFNAPHGFKILEMSDETTRITLPNRKLNHNHLGGVHACAMATVGEYCAGMTLLKFFGASKYRFILSELNVKYTYQGRTHLEGTCSPAQVDRGNVQSSLETDGKFLQPMITMIRDQAGNDVATVTTTWQIKAWDKVKTKA